ncbi:protein CREG1 [Athalia rosae]|uniref:protein CREG1 n=1 Tax=Athalia rosae TaxID=37344 RepID=UPI0020334DBC|nr:protein CREG1 [Athalia rosae]
MRCWRVFLFLLLLAVIQIEAGKYSADIDDFEEWQQFKEFQRWKHARKHQSRKYFRYFDNDLEHHQDEDDSGEEWPRDDPPPIDQAARMARYIVNQNNWTSIATISSSPDIASFPFVNVVSYGDGPLDNGTGMPYLYITPLDYTAQDLARDPRATLSMTLAEVGYCARKSYDPMDPRCPRVYLTGIMQLVRNTTAEFQVARNAVFGRHPWLETMPANHRFFFVKIKPIQIDLLDTFGGPKHITPEEYFAAKALPADIAEDYQIASNSNNDWSNSIRTKPRAVLV